MNNQGPPWVFNDFHRYLTASSSNDNLDLFSASYGNSVCYRSFWYNPCNVLEISWIVFADLKINRVFVLYSYLFFFLCKIRALAFSGENFSFFQSFVCWSAIVRIRRVMTFSSVLIRCSICCNRSTILTMHTKKLILSKPRRGHFRIISRKREYVLQSFVCLVCKYFANMSRSS